MHQFPATAALDLDCSPAAPRSLGPSPATQAGELLSRRYVEDFFGPEFARLLMRAAGLYVDGAPPVAITRRAFWMLCLASINEANDEAHGCLSQPVPKASWMMLFASVNQMDDVGGGIRRLTELAPVISRGLSITVGYSATATRLNFAVDETVADVRRAERYADLIAVVFHCALLWGVRRPIFPASVRLSERLADEDGSMAAQLSGVRRRVGPGTTVIYRREDMTQALGARRYKSWATPETTMFLEMVGRPVATHGADDPIAVVGKLREMLANSPLTQQTAARQLNMSVATLQRRLSEAGLSFRAISRETRLRKLRSLLATDSNLDDIAAELGFSERRALWRASQDWLGMSPARYRQALRDGTARSVA